MPPPWQHQQPDLPERPAIPSTGPSIGTMVAGFRVVPSWLGPSKAEYRVVGALKVGHQNPDEEYPYLPTSAQSCAEAFADLFPYGAPPWGADSDPVAPEPQRDRPSPRWA